MAWALGQLTSPRSSLPVAIMVLVSVVELRVKVVAHVRKRRPTQPGPGSTGTVSGWSLSDLCMRVLDTVRCLQSLGMSIMSFQYVTSMTHEIAVLVCCSPPQ
jgi:hypothetical protein